MAIEQGSVDIEGDEFDGQASILPRPARGDAGSFGVVVDFVQAELPAGWHGND